MEITKDIKAKVFGQYLGVKVDVSNTEWYKKEAESRNRFIEATLAGVNLHEHLSGGCIKHNIETQNKGFQWLDFDVFKLILKPLSDITDEDAIGIISISYGKCADWTISRNDGLFEAYSKEDSVKIFIKNGNITMSELSSREFDLKEEWTTPISINNCSIKVYQFLLLKGYDLPQYLLGGKTLKEVGLAIYENQL